MSNKLKPVFLLLLGCAALLSMTGVASARIGDTFSKVKTDEFFRYVRFDTAVRMVDGELITRPWGTLYKNRVEVRLRMGPDSTVTSMELLIDTIYFDSSWVRSRSLCANFIRSETAKVDTNIIRDLANEVEFVQRRNFHYLDAVPQLPATPTDAYQVFIGTRQSYDLPLTTGMLRLAWVELRGKHWISIKILKESLTEPRKG